MKAVRNSNFSVRWVHSGKVRTRENEAPHPGAALGHGWILFSKHMRARLVDFDDLFKASTGLTLEQYYACAFGVMQKTFVQNANSGIFSTVGFGAATNIGQVFDAFVNLKSQSPDDLVKALVNPVAVTGYKALRERPILNFPDNRSAILDPVTYFDTLTISPLFAVVKQLDPARTNEVFSAFGMACEDYAIGFLEGMYPSGLLARRLIPRAGRVDFLDMFFTATKVQPHSWTSSIKIGALRDESSVERSKRDRASGETWMEGLGRARNETERRTVHRAANEWADGDAIAAHV